MAFLTAFSVPDIVHCDAYYSIGEQNNVREASKQVGIIGAAWFPAFVYKVQFRGDENTTVSVNGKLLIDT